MFQIWRICALTRILAVVDARSQVKTLFNSSYDPPLPNPLISIYPEPNGYQDPGVVPSNMGFMLPEKFNIIRIAHVALGASAVLIFFPLGGILIRILNNRHMVWIHAGVQLFAYMILITASGMGIWMAKTTQGLRGYHPIMGMLLLALVAVQPVTELLNHYFYDRFPRIIALAHVHLWFGRILITFGIIHGGLGFSYADSKPDQNWNKAPRIAYGIVATIVWILYISIVAFWQDFRKEKGGGIELTEDEIEELRGTSTQEQELQIEDNQPRSTSKDFRSSAL